MAARVTSPCPHRTSAPGGSKPSGRTIAAGFRVLQVFAITFVPLADTSCMAQLERCAGKAVSPGDELSCPMPEWTDRGFQMLIPAAWDGKSALPVLLVMHGGGGNKSSAEKVTCPNGEPGGPECLPAMAAARGVAVVRPDGTGSRPLHNVRTWNAGGGKGNLNCASGGACQAGIDDIRYFRELVGELGRIVPIDKARIFATGLSNGGAMSHRLACELPDLIAAIVPVGGANQYAAGGGLCPRPVPVLHIHGTEDPCWSYVSSSDSCLEGTDEGVKIGVAETLETWRVTNGCDPTPVQAPMPDRLPSDGTTAVRVTYTGCKAPLEHIRVQGGGHTWPNGYAYLSTSRIGRVERDFGNEVILDFLLANPHAP